MFNWLKGWLNPTLYNSTTTFECNAPMPKVKAPKVEGVSEPVLSMLKAWEMDKKRFTVSVSHSLQNPGNWRLYNSIFTATVIFCDNVTKEEFEFYGELGRWSYENFFNQVWFIKKQSMFDFKVYPALGFKVMSCPSWLTDKEVKFLQLNVEPYYRERASRHIEIIQERLDRKEACNVRKSNLAKEKERLRLTKIYGEQK